MRLLRRSLYPLALGLWLFAATDRAQAATIVPKTLKSGTQVETLMAFSIDAPSELSLLLSTDFFAVATLFGPIVLDASNQPLAGVAIYDGKYHFIEDDTDFTAAGLFQAFPLTRPGDYLLTLTQVDNYFDPVYVDENSPGGFERTGTFFLDNYTCEFPAQEEPYCDPAQSEGTYSGTVSVQSVQPVPEPSTLSLLTLGAAVTCFRRRIQQRNSGTLRHRPSS